MRTGLRRKQRHLRGAICNQHPSQPLARRRNFPRATLRRKRIHNHAAANRHLRRITAQDKTIAKHADDRGFKAQLGQAGSAGLDLIPWLQHPHPCQYFRRADMRTDALPRAK